MMFVKSSWLAKGSVLASVALLVVGSATTADAQRARDGLILLYGFTEGSGDTVHDFSGFGDPLDLTIKDPDRTSWGDGFLTINDTTNISNPNPPQKVFDAITATEEITAEAWILPDNASLTGPARVITYSNPDNPGSDRNFSVGLDGPHVEVRLRRDGSTINGAGYEETDDVGPVIVEPTELIHIVYTRDAAGTSTIYADGVDVGDPDFNQTGALLGGSQEWQDDFLIALAHEHGDTSDVSRAFLGEYHTLAMYNRALSAGEVLQNFNAGPVPEPSSLALAALAIVGLLCSRRWMRA